MHYGMKLYYRIIVTVYNTLYYCIIMMRFGHDLHSEQNHILD